MDKQLEITTANFLAMLQDRFKSVSVDSTPKATTSPINLAVQLAVRFASEPADDSEELLQERIHRQAFRENFNIKQEKGNLDASLVLKHRRSFPGSCHINGPDGQMQEFTDVSLRIDVVEELPTFSLQVLINPNSSTHTSQYRKFLVDFSTCRVEINEIGDSCQFAFHVLGGQPTVSHNSDAPSTIAPGDFETLMANFPHGATIEGSWFANRDIQYADYTTRWGVKYWIGELNACRHDFVAGLRNYVTRWRELFMYEKREIEKISKPFEVEATITKISSDNNYYHISFLRPDGYRGAPGTILAILPLEKGLFGNNPQRIIHVLDPPEFENPWYCIQSTTDAAAGHVYCLLLGATDSHTLPAGCRVKIRIAVSDNEYTRAMIIRAHLYFKCLGPGIASRECQGVPWADHATIRHNIDFRPLIAPTSFQHPDPKPILNFNADNFPSVVRKLNKQQIDAAQMCAAPPNKMVFVNGAPGTGKTLFQSKLALYAAREMNWRILVCCSSNAALDNLMASILSTFAAEDPKWTTDPIMVTRIVAPSRNQLQDIARASNTPIGQIEESLEEYNLSTQRHRLATAIAEEHPNGEQAGDDARRYIQLHDEIIQRGSLSARTSDESRLPDISFHGRMVKAYDRSIVTSSQVVGTTTFMATCNAIMNSPGFALVITDETPAMRDDQFYSTFLFQENLQLLVCTGDPFQSFPFVMSQYNDNDLRNCVHRRISESGVFSGLVQFTVQYRMEDNLLTFVNETVYNGILSTSPLVIQGRPTQVRLEAAFSRKPLILWPDSTPVKLTGNNHLLDIRNGASSNDTRSSTINNAEADCATELVKQLLAYPEINAGSIMIICSYVAQRDRTLEKLAKLTPPITDVQVMTIDAALGQEADITIVMTSRTGTDTNPGHLCQLQRFVVSATRCRYMRFFLADLRFFTSHVNRSGLMGQFCVYMDRAGLVKHIDVPGHERKTGRDTVSAVQEQLIDLPAGFIAQCSTGIHYFIANDALRLK